ncbi:MAG: hypothetical protein ACPG5U_04370 [Planktomarina sp.]
MSGPIGCMIRPLGMRDKLTRNTADKWLKRIGIEIFPAAEGPLTPEHIHTDGWLTVCTLKNMEIWVGGGIFDIFNTLCQIDDFSKLGTGVVFVMDEAGGYYGLQEFYDGTPGWGGQVIVNPPRTWTRPDVGDSERKHRDPTYAALAQNIGADPILIERTVTGMNGNGRYGIAWHGNKGWVLARIGSDGHGQFQELDPNTYSKTGHPFDPAPQPDGWPSYWKQEHLFSAAQDHLARSWGGIALTELTHDHPMLVGHHPRVTITSKPS